MKDRDTIRSECHAYLLQVGTASGTAIADRFLTRPAHIAIVLSEDPRFVRVGADWSLANPRASRPRPAPAAFASEPQPFAREVHRPRQPPASLRWLQDNPGEHRMSDIAAAVDQTYIAVLLMVKSHADKLTIRREGRAVYVAFGRAAA
jgi:hypothetical protein